MTKTVIFTGSGGQGIMSMGTMLAEAAVDSGRHGAFMPSYGPEQRGGVSKCTVAIDDEKMPCPMAEYSELLVTMSLLAYDRFIYELLPGGVLLYDNTMITKTIERKDIKAIPVPAGDLAIKIGSPKVANVIVDGVLVGMSGIVTYDEFIKTLDRKFKTKSEAVRELNRKAFDCGFELAKEYI